MEASQVPWNFSCLVCRPAALAVLLADASFHSSAAVFWGYEQIIFFSLAWHELDNLWKPGNRTLFENMVDPWPGHFYKCFSSDRWSFPE